VASFDLEAAVHLHCVPNYNSTLVISKWLAKQDLLFCIARKEYLDRTYAFP